MDCAVIYSEAALADLDGLTAYIATDNSEVAARFANRLVDLAESLRNMPGKGRPVNLRRFGVGNHCELLKI